MKTITIELHPDGTTKVEADGFVNNACSLATKPYVDAIQGEVLETIKKPDVKATTTNKQTLGRG